MEDFNLLEGVLKDVTIVVNERFYLLGKKGDENVMWNDVESWFGDAQRTKGYILLYDKSTNSLDWKSIYKTSKGLYFKKDGRHYIQK